MKSTLYLGQRVNVSVIVKESWQSRHILYYGIVTGIEGYRIKVGTDSRSTHSGDGSFNPIARGGFFYLSAYSIEPAGFPAITSLQQFESYLKAKGYHSIILNERPQDGFYACIPKGKADIKDFSQTGLHAAHWLAKGTKDENFEWVRLAFNDCANEAIINA